VTVVTANLKKYFPTMPLLLETNICITGCIYRKVL